MPRRKISGPAHKDTVKSPRALDEGRVIVKRSLTDLKLKNGEIENYYDPGSDRLLYEALRNRLIAFGGNAAKAFAEPFYKPRRDGTPGPLVKKVKLLEPSTLNVPVHEGKGVADNDTMVRIDVFHAEGDGYYFVPIYVADTLRPELPNRACVQRKPYMEWKVMREEDFCFSLYPNDLLHIVHKRELKLSRVNDESSLPESMTVKDALLYYIKAGISSASISCRNHDNSYEVKSLGIYSLDLLEKYSVDVLGEIHRVEREPRLPFTQKRS
jgi:CRISPR-associated endonuclease Csn1